MMRPLKIVRRFANSPHSCNATFCSPPPVMSRPRENEFNSYFTINALLPSITQPAQHVHRMPPAIGSRTRAVLPVYNGGPPGPEPRRGIPDNNIMPADMTQTVFNSVLPTFNQPVTCTCPLGDGCTSSLEATTTSLYAHLPLHGHVYKHRDRAPCPWPGCSKISRWGNVARHILERHIAVKRQCKYCGKTYKREGDLKSHLKGCIEAPCVNPKSAENGYMQHTV
ncbi:hypothetical protein EDD17DRAFT_171687 [Pisolithus thermaeus]|nr:hypothetical protein EDD17DRAFT_171687 [Pisolithus thermaeus]